MAGRREAPSGYPEKDWSVGKAIEETPGGQTYNFGTGEYNQQKQGGNLWNRLINLIRGDPRKDWKTTIEDRWVMENPGRGLRKMPYEWYQSEWDRMEQALKNGNR